MNCCEDLKKVLKDHENLFQIHPTYGSILTWIEIHKEKTRHKTHQYGMQVKYCPFCGKKLPTL
jgi:hypothetical protein